MLKLLLTHLNQSREDLLSIEQQQLIKMQKTIERMHRNSRINLLRTDYLE